MATLIATRPMTVAFVCYGTPQPQGSMRAFMPKNARFPVVTSDNPKMKSFRQEVSKAALLAAQHVRLQFGSADLPFAKHQPVVLSARFYFSRPGSIPKKRFHHVVRPDVDKLARLVADSLTGIVLHDDSQIVEVHASKHYGAPERVEVEVREKG